MDCARRRSRYGYRDATMLLVAYRHGLRASELCDLQWHQIELDAGRMHVRRAKNGTPSVHPIRGDEIRALRKLRRENPTEAAIIGQFVLCTGPDFRFQKKDFSAFFVFLYFPISMPRAQS
jgi:integrase